MRPLLLLSLLAAAQVQTSLGCPASDNRPCPVVPRGTSIVISQDALDKQNLNLSSEDFRRVTYSALMNGLSSLSLKADFPTPYEILLTGQDAVPLATNKNGQVLMAAGRFGKGKIVVLGHERYLYDDTFKGLLLNAVAWLKPNDASTVGLYPKMSALTSLLQGAGHTATASDTWQPSMGVFCMDAAVGTQAKDLVNFVESGGGVLIAGDASAWSGSDVITKATGNKIASVAGIYFTNQPASVGTRIAITEVPPQYRVYVSDLGDFKEDTAAVLSGVDAIDFSWYSRPIVHGRLAFPIAYGKKTGVVIAGAYYGNGKVLFLTHPDQERNVVLMSNGVKWLRGEQQGSIAINPSVSNLESLKSTFTSAGLTTVVTTLQGATNVDVYVTEDKSNVEADLIHAFVAKGGGLLVAAEADSWSKQNPKLNVLEDHPVNNITNKLGITITKDWDWGPWKRSEPTNRRVTPYEFRRFVGDLVDKGRITVPEEHNGDFTTDALQMLKLKKSDTHQLNLIYYALAKGFSSTSLNPPSEQNPVKDLSERTYWYLKSYAPTSINIVAVNGTATAGSPWRSTGLYAQPGRAIVFRVPKIAVGSSLEIQFGCQSDNLWTAGWDTFYRYPVMVPYNYPLESESLTLFSQFGGLIYVVVKSPSALGGLEFVVENAEEVAYYKDGTTDPADWEKTIRFKPAPWAEIQTKDMILTVRSEYVRNLTSESIVKSADMWNRGMDAAAKLATRPFLYHERIVTDSQISAGALHAGYPIMAKGDWRGEYLANATMMVEKRYAWGIFHELGHNLQQKVWDYPFSAEVTCNLWAVYVAEEAFGVSRNVAWTDEWTPEYRFSLTKQYVQNSTLNVESFEGDYHTYKLNMYLHLQEAFGWQPFMNLFTKYQSMLNLKLDSPGVANLWVKMFSQEVNKNLVPYFKRLKWPVSAEVEQELSSLPEWTTNPLNDIP